VCPTLAAPCSTPFYRASCDLPRQSTWTCGATCLLDLPVVPMTLPLTSGAHDPARPRPTHGRVSRAGSVLALFSCHSRHMQKVATSACLALCVRCVRGARRGPGPGPMLPECALCVACARLVFCTCPQASIRLYQPAPHTHTPHPLLREA